MLIRPFTTHCYSTTTPRGGNLQVIVDFEAGADFAPDLLERLNRPFRGLADMGIWGGMAGENHPPQHSSMVLISEGRAVGASTVQWDFEATNVDPGTAFVIQNIVHFFALFVTPVEKLVLRSPLLRDGAPVPQDLPLDYEPHPFTVHDERENLMVTVDVDYANRQAPDAAEPFRVAWEGWYEVAAYGGFCSEDFPVLEGLIYVEDDLKVTSTGIGGVFDDVVIDDAGWACLVNMLQSLHHRIAPIAEVTIE